MFALAGRFVTHRDGAAEASQPRDQHASLGCYAILPLLILCENMMSSTNPEEVHNVLHNRQRMTEPRLQLPCTENLVQCVF